MKAARNGGDDGKAYDKKGICDDSMHSRCRNGTRMQRRKQRNYLVMDAR